MTGKEIVLGLLEDGQPHSLEEFELYARLQGAEHITVHSRVADLRRDGYHIVRMFSNGTSAYQLNGREEVPYRVREREQEPVQGFLYQSVVDEGELYEAQNGNICQIVGRADSSEATENELVDYGPAFRVRFGDGSLGTAYSSELHPWYPT